LQRRRTTIQSIGGFHHEDKFVAKTVVGILVCALGLANVPVTHAEPVQVQILSAVVKDQRLADAAVILQKNGRQSVIATTDGQGNAILNSDFNDAEDTLVIVKKGGYSNLVAKCPCKGMTYALSPIMTSLDGLRIVLNWGELPRDLDSHLAFSQHHIFYRHKTDGPGTDANLDVDDIDSYGPETITIEKKHSGDSYVYAVHNYSDRSNPDTQTLSASGAKVLVYIGKSLVRSYYVPKGVRGNLWNVFRITAEGEFQDINVVKGTTVESAEVLDSANTYLNPTTHIDVRAISAADTSSAKSLNRAGEQAYREGDVEHALELFQRAIDIDSNYGQAYSNLGLAYIKSGRTAEAIWANRKAIALASGANAGTVRASSYFNIAKIYEGAGQYRDALAQYQSARREKANSVYDNAIERVKALIH
jgi:hypothetical protein